MNLQQKIVNSYESNKIPGYLLSEDWHLSFLNPEVFGDDESCFIRRTKIINEQEVVLDYAVIDIVRPWLDKSFFSIPFTHTLFKSGEISDGKGNGFWPEINTGLVITRYIRIGDLYESNNWQIIGWIVDNIPFCPK